MAARHHAEDICLALSPLVPDPLAWLGNMPPTSIPSFDLEDPTKVRAVLTDVLQKSLAHFQHGNLLMQDVNVARVSSWLHAESMKGAPGIFEENDVELTKKLKETISQSDNLLKLGLGGTACQGGRAGGGGGGQGGPGKGKGKGKGKGGKGKGSLEHQRCFHCKQKVSFCLFFFSAGFQCFFHQGHLRQQGPIRNGKKMDGPAKKN